MGRLRGLYDEQLKLEAPAKYWEELEGDYRKQGHVWAVGTGIAVGVLAIAVFKLVYLPPEIFKSDRFTFSGFKGAVLVGGLISLFIYLINLMTRLAVSSHHLARDAKERYQLTRVYLALKKDGSITAEDRSVLLSAIFSRADTGLLKHDGAPEFPLAAALAALKVK